MDLHTITMERPKARRLFLEYRQAVRERHNDEDEQIMRGYRALARGQQLISLPEMLTAGGLDDKGLPRLAVMRADLPWCYVYRTRFGAVTFSQETNPSSRRRRGVYRFPAATLPAVPQENGRHWWWDYRAMVPPVPPALRPKHSLANYEVLWEATWERAPRPPRDPVLLRHIGGDAYAVVAMWDLTDLERAVLAGRRFTP